MRSRSTKPDIRRAVFSAVLGLSGYYLTRAWGGSQLDAMVVATGVTAARVAYAAVRSRNLDLVACYMMLMHGFKIVIAVATHSPRCAMLAGHVGALLFVVFMLVSWAVGKPLTETVVDALRPDWVQQHVVRHGWTTADLDAYHRLHLRLTLLIALIRAIQLFAAIAVIILFSPDISQPVLELVNIPVKICSAVVIVAAVGRFLRRINKKQHDPPTSGETDRGLPRVQLTRGA